MTTTMHKTTRALLALAAAALLAAPAPARAAEPIRPRGEAPQPRFDRLHDYDAVTDLLHAYARAYPDWVKLTSIGKSGQGRDMWLLTVNNPATGPDLGKPAMYVDGNIHANEVQGTEAVLYVLDSIVKGYGKLDRITELADRAALYLVPMVNPDGRAMWFAGPSTPHFPRTVMVPVDDDRDGVADEDPYDDLDGDGIITQMRKKVPMGQGHYRLDPKDPRILVPVEGDELGDYEMLGEEGIDNDGDGKVNEDTAGYVDPNRSWGYGWQPRYVQDGSCDYPLEIPESRSIAVWALSHPNIGAVQSFHNFGRMILRGPDAKIDPPYPGEDLKVYDLIGKEGEKILPGYKYLISWKDLYTVYGSTTEHFYRLHGAIAFTNEMYEPPTDFDGDGKTTPQEEMKFNDLLTFGRQFVPWKPYHHPQYGDVEIGGFRQDVGRVPEGWMLEEEVHRNAAFVLFHASHLPELSIGEPTVAPMGKDLWRLTVPVVNSRAIPTMTAYARNNKVERPDIATVEGARVVASGLVDDPWLNQVEVQEHRPERLEVPGVKGLSTRLLMFVVAGQGEVTVVYDSLKGGKLTRKVRLAESS
jgi:Zinc carboxypeptidase